MLAEEYGIETASLVFLREAVFIMRYLGNKGFRLPGKMPDYLETVFLVLEPIRLVTCSFGLAQRP